MSEENDKINRIAKEIDELREKIVGIEETLKRHCGILSDNRRMLQELVDNLSVVLVLDYVKRQSSGFPDKSELEEVNSLARENGISVAEMIKRLEAQGTLPPSIKSIKEAIRMLREMLIATVKKE